MRVLVLATYPQGTAPGQRFRFEQHAQRLSAQGIELKVSSYLSADVMSALYRRGHYAAKVLAVGRGAVIRARDLLRARGYDAVLIHREAAPLGYPVIERLLAALGVPYVFDFDDAIHLSNASAANRFIAPLKFSTKTAIIVRHAGTVVAGNEYLAEWARHHGGRVTVIPTTIDTVKYRVATTERRTDQRVCIGWSGSLTTARYLDTLAPVLRDLQRQYGIRLRVIGDESYRIEGAEIEALPWRAETEVADLNEIDIGVMPLPDDEWARGKCGLKALQYMALGKATVMSPVGVNRRIAAGDAARLAETPEQWRAVLAELICDAGSRERLGRRGRERVERDFSADAILPRWATVLRAAART